MSKGTPPTPPNPVATAGAQTAQNVQTALANAYLNNTNQVTPLGSLTYSKTGAYNLNDVTTGNFWDIPQFTATQTLTPQEQAIQDESQGAKFNLAQLSNTQSGRVGSILGQPFDISGAPPAGTPPFLSAGMPTTTLPDTGTQQGTYGASGPIQSQLNPYSANFGFGGQVFDFGQTGPMVSGIPGLGNVASSYGPADNFSADRARVEESLYGRLNPQLGIEQSRIQQQLSDQGITPGSPAYDNAMRVYNQQANDARLAVTQQAGQEQQRLADMAAKQAGFQNAAEQQIFQQQEATGTFANQAQQQAYLQQLGRGQFANTAQAQAYQQALGAGQFANSAQAQLEQQLAGRAQFGNQAQQNMFQQAVLRGQFGNQALAQQVAQLGQQYGAQNDLRQRYLAEQYALRNQPLNEITAMLSGSQIQQPGFLTTPTNQIPTTDIASLINQNFSQNFQNYQQQSNLTNQLLGGILGAGSNLGAAAIRYSDRRMKENIHRVGTVFAGTPQPVQEVADVDSDEIKKLPIYSYTYKADPASTRHIGPMAQDVEKIDPGAVHNVRGRKAIDTARVMGSILRAA